MIDYRGQTELIGTAIAKYAARVIWNKNENNEVVAVTVFGDQFPNKAFTEQVEGDNTSEHRRKAALARALSAMVIFTDAENNVSQA